jgi:hypothetical protein
MIVKGGYELVARRKGNMVAQAVYRGLRLVWQAVRSCFGSGIWVPSKPWLGNENWKNHN